jgi:hypothetical protein
MVISFRRWVSRQLDFAWRPASFLRGGVELSLHILKTSAGRHTFIVLKQVAHWQTSVMGALTRFSERIAQPCGHSEQLRGCSGHEITCLG